MDRRNLVRKILLCIGAAFILSSIAWYTWKYLLLSVQHFIENAHVLTDHTLPTGYNRFGVSGLADITASLLYCSVLLILSIIVLKCIRCEKNRQNLKICACFLFGFESTEIWIRVFDTMDVVGTVRLALSGIGIILIALVSLFPRTEQDRSKTRPEKFGIAITDISAMLFFFFAGYFTQLAIESVGTFHPEGLKQIQEIYKFDSGNAVAMTSIALCFFMSAGLTMLFAGRHHFINYKQNYSRKQLWFGVSIFLIQSITVFIWVGQFFLGDRIYYRYPDIRFVIFLLSPLYLIGAVLLSISARRGNQHENKITQGIAKV